MIRAYQNKKAELNGPELRVPPVGLGGPGGTSRYGHYWDIAAPRDVNQIKSPIISVEPTDYNGSKEFCSVSFKIHFQKGNNLECGTSKASMPNSISRQRYFSTF